MAVEKVTRETMAMMAAESIAAVGGGCWHGVLANWSCEEMMSTHGGRFVEAQCSGGRWVVGWWLVAWSVGGAAAVVRLVALCLLEY